MLLKNLSSRSFFSITLLMAAFSICADIKEITVSKDQDMNIAQDTEQREDIEPTNIDSLSDDELTKLQIEVGNKINKAQEKLAKEQKKAWFNVKTNEVMQVEQELEAIINEYKEILAEKENRKKQKAVNACASIVVMADAKPVDPIDNNII